MDAAGLVYQHRREQLRDVPVREELPDLDAALVRFEQSLRQMVEAVHASGSQLVLLTQPSVYYAGLSAEHEKLLWIAFLGKKDAPQARYATASLERALQRFNDTTLRVCADSEAECIDVARALESGPREAYYYDDAHFTELGAERLASVIADWFAQRGTR